MVLAKEMFDRFRRTIVGTITPTDKKSRTDEDIPFLRLSKKYDSPWQLLQIDLGIALINYAIEREFEETSKRPSWVRQMNFVPCDCEKCYFCVNGHTTGIAHRRKRGTRQWYLQTV